MAETKVKKPFNPLEFKMKFKAAFATGIFIFIALVLFTLLGNEDNTYKELVESAVTFLIGGAMGAIITFYFDGNESAGQSDPGPIIQENQIIGGTAEPADVAEALKSEEISTKT